MRFFLSGRREKPTKKRSPPGRTPFFSLSCTARTFSSNTERRRSRKKGIRESKKSEEKESEPNVRYQVFHPGTSRRKRHLPRSPFCGIAAAGRTSSLSEPQTIIIVLYSIQAKEACQEARTSPRRAGQASRKLPAGRHDVRPAFPPHLELNPQIGQGRAERLITKIGRASCRERV